MPTSADFARLVVAQAPVELVGTVGLGSHDNGPPLGTEVGLLKDRGGAIRPDHAADRHEEADRPRSESGTSRGAKT